MKRLRLISIALLVLALSIAFISCDSDSDKEELNLHAPSWLQGTWVDDEGEMTVITSKTAQNVYDDGPGVDFMEFMSFLMLGSDVKQYYSSTNTTHIWELYGDGEWLYILFELKDENTVAVTVKSSGDDGLSTSYTMTRKTD